MNLFRQNKARIARRRLFAATVVAITVFAIDALSGGSLRALSRSAGTVVWRVGEDAAHRVLGSGFFSSRRALLTENAILKQEIAGLQTRAGSYEVLKSENASLRTMARLAEEDQGITAPIVSSITASPYGTFMVGAGSADGVSVGSLVLVGPVRGEASNGAGDNESGNFVVGSVSDVGKNVSLVTEVFAPNVSSEATIQGASVTLVGQGGGNARGVVPRALPVTPGDPVFSSRFAGRSVGIVGAVREDSAHTHQNIYIRLPVSLSALQFVYVIPLP